MTRIRALRLDRKISMRKAAEDLSLPYTTYVNYEQGEREPNSEMLVALANYYHVSVDYLIGRSDVRSSEPSAMCFPSHSLSRAAQKIGVAYDKATPKERKMVDYILSDYIDDATDDASDLPPLQIAASNGAKLELTDDLLDLDLPDGNSKLP